MDDDDERLVRAIHEGDGESFGVLYDRTRGFLLDAVIRPRVGALDAEDVLSETFRTALAKLDRFEWRGIGVVRWLSAIARRKAQERVRRSYREPLPCDLAAELSELPDGTLSAEAEMIRVERLRILREKVAATLGGLPPRYAEALRLRLLEGRERAECASALGVSIGTFDVVLFRATKAFAKRWRPL